MYTSSLATLFLLASLAIAAPPLPKPEDVSAPIDTAFLAEWKKQNLTPEALADDAASLRRLSLDLAGTVPPPLKARDYLMATATDRRVRLVDALLEGEQFPDHWGRVWTAHLTGKRATKQEKYDGRRLQEFLRDSFAANKSYGRIVTELICGEGLSESSGPANFLLRYEAKPPDLAGAVAKSFLGTSLQCAQCHNHPFENWKKDDFWGVAAYFSRVRMLEYSGDNEYLTSLQETRRGELEVPDPDAKPAEDGTQPKKKIKPRLPGDNSPPPQANRREALAKWVTDASNPYFARHAVNQVWTQLLGRPLGKVRNKDIAEDADASHEVWNVLTDDFKASGYDFKRLVRIIVLSKTYQLGAGGGAGDAPANEADAEIHHQKVAHFARFPTRALSVDQVYRSIVQATGHTGDPEPEPAKPEVADDMPDEDNAADRPVEALSERSQTVQRALALLNGDYVHQAVQAGAKLTLKINGPKPGPDHIDWIFLATLARHPTKDENAAMVKLLDANKGAGGLEDVWWVVLNSAEFNTNH
jgi:hypothetical protein